MAKIGRNTPCPCGSGKKYKKCCLGKGAPLTGVPTLAVVPRSPSAAPSADAPSRELPLPPHTLARAFEKSEHYQRMKRHHPQRAAHYCTPGTLARQSTEQLIAHFAKLGVDASRERYLRDAEHESSAWAIGEQWRASIEHTLSPYWQDFVTLGACELWNRYLPERPSVERLDEWMEDGYERLWGGDCVGACDRWLEVWAHLRPRLRPEMRTVEATASVFTAGEPVYNWIQDLVLELTNAAQDDPRYAEHGRQLCHAVLAQFPDEGGLFRINFRADLGEFLYLLGEDEAGEQMLRELIRDYPESAAGYARLAEVLGYGPTRARGSLDVSRAIELLEAALARPVEDAQEYDLQARLRELREHAQYHNDSAMPPTSHDTERATKAADS